MRIGWSVRDRVQGRLDTLREAQDVRVRVSAEAEGTTLTVVFIEGDGTSWSHALHLRSGARDERISLSEFTLGGGSKLPVGYPGEWNTHLPAAAGRGGAGDKLQLEQVQQVQLVLEADAGARGGAIEVDSIALTFE